MNPTPPEPSFFVVLAGTLLNGRTRWSVDFLAADLATVARGLRIAPSNKADKQTHGLPRQGVRVREKAETAELWWPSTSAIPYRDHNGMVWRVRSHKYGWRADILLGLDSLLFLETGLVVHPLTDTQVTLALEACARTPVVSSPEAASTLAKHYIDTLTNDTEGGTP